MTNVISSAPGRSAPVDAVPETGVGATAGPAPVEGGPSGPSMLSWLLPVVLTVSIGMFLSTLDSAIVGIAYPAIGKDLGATNESVQWITTAFKLSQGVVIPAAVWLCRRFGLRRMYLVALLTYLGTSILCSLAGSIESLVAFRIIQAIPGALTPIVCVGIIYRLIPRAVQPGAFAVYAMVAISAPGFAPFFGGYLVEYLNWRFIFLADVPLAILGMVAVSLFLPAMPPIGVPPRFDVPGFILAATGSFAFLLALSKGPAWGWTSYPILVLLGLAVNALVAFVAVELRVANPLLDLRIFTFRPFVLALVILEVLFVGLNAMFGFLPSFLQQAQQLTPSQAGMIFVPQAVAWIVAIPLSGLLWRSFGPKPVTILGLLLMGGSTLILGHLTVDLPHQEVVLLLCSRALGVGLIMLPMLGGAVSVLPPHLMPDGIAFRTIVQRTGAALGFAAVSDLVTVHRAQHFANQAALLDVSTPYHDPTVYQLQQKGPGGLLPLWQELQVHSSTAAYGDAYTLLGLAALAAIVVTFFTSWPTPPRTPRRQLVEVGV